MWFAQVFPAHSSPTDLNILRLLNTFNMQLIRCSHHCILSSRTWPNWQIIIPNFALQIHFENILSSAADRSRHHCFKTWSATGNMPCGPCSSFCKCECLCLWKGNYKWLHICLKFFFPTGSYHFRLFPWFKLTLILWKSWGKNVNLDSTNRKMICKLLGI